MGFFSPAPQPLTFIMVGGCAACIFCTYFRYFCTYFADCTYSAHISHMHGPSMHFGSFQSYICPMTHPTCRLRWWTPHSPHPPPRQTLQQCAGAFTAMQQRMLELDELYRKEVRERKALYNAMQVLSHPEQQTRPTLSRNARGETKWPTLTGAGRCPRLDHVSVGVFK